MNFAFFTGTGEAYAAYGHMVLFVQLGEGQGTDPAHTWLVDCAPGPPSPSLPMPLSDDPDNIQQNWVPGEYNRITRGFAQSSSIISPVPAPGTDLNGASVYTSAYTADQAKDVWDAHALWQMEYKGAGKASEFKIIYQFSEQEFLPVDERTGCYAPTQEHYRLAMKEIGEPLDEHKSPYELVKTIWHALWGTFCMLLDVQY